jgi:hypothetical protein
MLLALTVVAVLVIAVLACEVAATKSSDKAATGATVRFDTTGWRLKESSEMRMLWTDSDGDALSLDRVRGLADLPSIDDLKSVRAWCRELARGNNGGLVSADVLDLRGTTAVRLIYKREELPAYGYTGMMIIPGKGEHFVIVVASVERGTTGVRDALVTAQLFEQGKLDPTKTDDHGRLEGWFHDPYESEFDASALSSVADDERYDSLVPSHPLSKIRRTLRAIAESFHWSQ